MRLLRDLRRAIAFARTYGDAYWVLERMSDRQLVGYGIARSEIWQVADRVARGAGRAAAR